MVMQAYMYVQPLTCVTTSPLHHIPCTFQLVQIIPSLHVGCGDASSENLMMDGAIIFLNYTLPSLQLLLTRSRHLSKCTIS